MGISNIIEKTPDKDEESKPLQETGDEILIHDTRGQIWMDQKEMSQLDLLITGKVKDKQLVEQRSYRYAYMLWEFWRNEKDLFPAGIKKPSTS